MRTDLDFNAAVRDYQRFIAEHGLSTELLWVFREDVTVAKRRVCLRWPLPEANPHLVEEVYERGREKGLGLQLNTFCLAGNQPCCYVWVPEDEMEADYAMLSALKMSVPIEPIHAKMIRSGWVWEVVSRLDSRSNFRGFMTELPKRSESSPNAV